MSAMKMLQQRTGKLAVFGSGVVAAAAVVVLLTSFGSSGQPTGTVAPVPPLTSPNPGWATGLQQSFLKSQSLAQQGAGMPIVPPPAATFTAIPLTSGISDFRQLPSTAKGFRGVNSWTGTVSGRGLVTVVAGAAPSDMSDPDHSALEPAVYVYSDTSTGALDGDQPIGAFVASTSINGLLAITSSAGASLHVALQGGPSETWTFNVDSLTFSSP